ncbi:MAG: hypothetical protein AAFR27_05645 [Pseudomonadota bacterium]
MTQQAQLLRDPVFFTARREKAINDLYNALNKSVSDVAGSARHIKQLLDKKQAIADFDIEVAERLRNNSFNLLAPVKYGVKPIPHTVQIIKKPYRGIFSYSETTNLVAALLFTETPLTHGELVTLKARKQQ